jgi:FeS assembly SUF system protein
MKPLPVVQSPPPQASASPGPTSVEQRPQQTAGMMSDPQKSAVLMPLIVKALSTVFDPEMPVNIYELGLVYDIIVETSTSVGIRMTLTAPACPAAQCLPGQVKKAVEAVPGVADVRVDIVWDPPWSRDRMSDAAKLQLGMF